MELRFKTRDKIATLYWSPKISEKGFIAAWKQKDPKYKHGFVVRMLWLGFVVRWGYRPDIFAMLGINRDDYMHMREFMLPDELTEALLPMLGEEHH